MGKTALIYGAGGQDGHYLADLLLSKGYTIGAVVRRSSLDNTTRLNKFKSNSNFEIVEGDITDYSSILNTISKYNPNEIYNLAAQSHVATSFEQPSYTFNVNANGPLNILEAIKNIDKDIKYYQASTSEMFGSNYDKDENGKNYQDENTVLHPRSPYAVAKVAAHNLVANYRESYGIFGCCGILFNHESPMRGENFVTRKITKWIGKYSKELFKYTKNSSLEEYESIEHGFLMPFLELGNLNSYRDWGHAKDYVRAMWMMLQHDKPDDYVVATGVAHRVADFLKVSFANIGIEDWSPYVKINPKFYRPAEVDYLCGRSDKIRNTLGWKPEVTFEQLVKEMVEYDIQQA